MKCRRRGIESRCAAAVGAGKRCKEAETAMTNCRREFAIESANIGTNTPR